MEAPGRARPARPRPAPLPARSHGRDRGSSSPTARRSSATTAGSATRRRGRCAGAAFGRGRAVRRCRRTAPLLRRQRGVLVHGQWAASDCCARRTPSSPCGRCSMGIPLPGRRRAAASAGAFRERVAAFRPRRLSDRLVRLPDADQAHRGGDPRPRRAAGSRASTCWSPASSRRTSNYARAAPPSWASPSACTSPASCRSSELDAAISATDLCLNLRYPTAGETSASLLRILAVGRPVVVSDYADFGDLPADLAVHIPPGEGEMREARRGAGAAARRPLQRSRGWARRRVATWPMCTLPSARRTSWWPPPRSSRSSRPSPIARRSRVRAPRRCKGGCRAGSSSTAARTGRPASVASSRSRSSTTAGSAGCRARRCRAGSSSRCSSSPRGVTSIADGAGSPCRRRSSRGRRGASSSSCAVREAAARLLIKPTLQIAEGHRPLGAWEWDRWV